MGEMNQTFGEGIIEDLRELCDTLKKGERLESRYTVRTVQLDLTPREFKPEDVRLLRDALQVSQPLFAQIVGTSVETIESWEQGIRKPPSMACRLLEMIANTRDDWTRLIRNAAKEVVA